MKKHWWLLTLGLAACGKQVEITADVAVQHKYDAALQRQVELLQAEQLKVSASAAGLSGRWRSTRAKRSATPPG